MSRTYSKFPDWHAWRSAAGGLRLRKRGRELVGPCPNCGGTDRFSVKDGGRGRAVFLCRHCCPNRHAGSDAYRRIIQAAGLAPYEGDGGFQSRPFPASPLPPDTEKQAAAVRIWTASTASPGATAPISDYLKRRGAWPPSSALPPSVRWLSCAAAEHLGRKVTGGPLPPDCAGAAVYRFEDGAKLVAVQIEPLASDGERKPWLTDDGKQITRKGRGFMRSGAFRVTDMQGMGTIHVCEGPVDALTIAAVRGVEAWAAGGANGLAPLAGALAATRRPVVIEADGDGPGRTAAAGLQDALHHAGAEARLIYWPTGSDPAEGLAADWLERAAQYEADGMDRETAIALAWREELLKGNATNAMQQRC